MTTFWEPNPQIGGTEGYRLFQCVRSPVGMIIRWMQPKGLAGPILCRYYWQKFKGIFSLGSSLSWRMEVSLTHCSDFFMEWEINNIGPSQKEACLMIPIIFSFFYVIQYLILLSLPYRQNHILCNLVESLQTSLVYLKRYSIQTLLCTPDILEVEMVWAWSQIAEKT